MFLKINLFLARKELKKLATHDETTSCVSLYFLCQTVDVARISTVSPTGLMNDIPELCLSSFLL